MELTSDNLTIHIGDKVSFHASTNGNSYLTGTIGGVACGDVLTVFIYVNEFLTCTIAASEIVRINNLFINLNNFSRNINLSIAM